MKTNKKLASSPNTAASHPNSTPPYRTLMLGYRVRFHENRPDCRWRIIAEVSALESAQVLREYWLIFGRIGLRRVNPNDLVIQKLVIGATSNGRLTQEWVDVK